MSTVVIRDTPGGWEKVLNGVGVQTQLNLTSLSFIEIAKGVFISQSRHESTPPVEYLRSFGVRRIRSFVNGMLVYGRHVYNNDPTAEWVEYGAHAGGKTRVLRYRVFGRTVDIMDARSHL